MHRDAVSERRLAIDLGSDENVVHPLHARDVLLNLPQHFLNVRGCGFQLKTQQDRSSNLAATGGRGTRNNAMKNESPHHRSGYENDQPCAVHDSHLSSLWSKLES